MEVKRIRDRFKRSILFLDIGLTNAVIINGTPRLVPLTAYRRLVVAAAAGGVTKLGVGPAPVLGL